MLYKEIESRKEKIRRFIKSNPNTTHKEIKRKLHIKIDKVYEGGMAEAFRDSGVNPPRTFERKSREEKRQIIIDYIRKNPNVGSHIIRKDTKINFLTLFKDTQSMFEASGIPYLRKNNILLRERSLMERNKIIIDIIKKNPFIGVEELMRLSNINIYRHFSNIKELYKRAGVKYLGKGIKKRNNKRKIVIEFIKKNPFATQREINNSCKTHVQFIFKRGIFEAYEAACVQFPFERIKIHGSAMRNIRNEAIKFEEEIARKLSSYGRINRLVKTKRGFADIILERKDRKAVIEVKNYLVHEISISQINQLNKYLEDIKSNRGFLICKKKSKRDTFLIGENRIFVLLESELSKIPEIMDL